MYQLYETGVGGRPYHPRCSGAAPVRRCSIDRSPAPGIVSITRRRSGIESIHHCPVGLHRVPIVLQDPCVKVVLFSTVVTHNGFAICVDSPRENGACQPRDRVWILLRRSKVCLNATGTDSVRPVGVGIESITHVRD